jgi:thiamine-phosphate pyrophosphorylase
MNNKEISQLHYITQDIEGKSHAQLAHEACLAEVDWVQVRVKGRSFDEWLEISREAVAVCRKFPVKVIINDNPEIAKLSGADGVHLGKEDISPKEARAILGDQAIIGGTANSMEDAQWLLGQGVDYIGLGPFRFTQTKKKLAPVLGEEGVKNILTGLKSNIPVVVIGGVLPEDVETIISAGAHGVAVSSAINFSNDKKSMVEAFQKASTLRTNKKTNTSIPE